MPTVNSYLCLLFKALLLALQKIKVPEEQKKFCIEAPEPLLTFALSCGMYSSPAVSSEHSFFGFHDYFCYKDFMVDYGLIITVGEDIHSKQCEGRTSRCTA